jgi:hypothetical protein
MKKILIILFLFLTVSSCTIYKIKVIEYDGTGYSLYLPMKKYGIDKWYDDNIIYYSEEMAKFKIQKWKSGEYHSDPWKTPKYIKIN